MKYALRMILAASTAAALSACGGGGGSAPAVSSATVSAAAAPATPGTSGVSAQASGNAVLASPPAGGLDVKYLTQVASTYTPTLAAPIAGTQKTNGFESATQNQRGYAIGNFGGNGCPAIFHAPSYDQNQPELPVQVLTGDCKGNFTLNTPAVISGAIPVTGFATAVLTGDFNKSGNDSVLVIDSGLEDVGSDTPGFLGHHNLLLLNQGGKLVDMSATNLPQDDNNGLLNYNHVSSMYHANVPGDQTIVITRLGGRRVAGAGVTLLKNDGTGKFTASAAQLPKEVAYTLFPGPANPTPSNPNGLNLYDPAVDYVMPGTATLADLDGSGSPYLIAGTYNSGTNVTHQSAVFIYKLVGGAYQQYASIPMPAAYASIPYAAGSSQHLGVSSIVAGDFEGTGHPDLAVIWEGMGVSRLQLIHNDGAGNFTDASANIPVVDPAQYTAVTAMKAIDVNNDGKVQLELLMTNGTPLSAWGAWRPVLSFANGSMQFMDIFNGASPATVAQQLGVNVDTDPVSLRFEALGSGKTDLLAMNWGKQLVASAFTLFNDLMVHGLLHR